MNGLIGVAELAEAIMGPDAGARPAVLDVRWRLAGPPGRADHAAGHIPGAAYVDLDTELAAPPGAGRHPLPEPGVLQAALRRAGVRAGGAVVAYDDGNATVAARAWWLLRWAGVPADRVAVLDGGWAAWQAAGLPVSTDPVHPEPGDLLVRPGGMPVVDADGAAALGRDGVLLDARAEPRYRGETEPVDPRAGHVPGARNAPAAAFAGPEARWLPRAEIAAMLLARGLGAGPAGAYCGSGINASALVLAAEYAGVRGPADPVALYAGSWSDWSADPARPAAVGAAP